MRSAVFVDAGYLYAQGSAILAGRKLARAQVSLDLNRTIAQLRIQSSTRTAKAPILRIYWYDGLARGEYSHDQKRLAFMEDVKLRLGIVNQEGQQKGVDSLIVTDLVELARNHAITDAVLLSGDEDLRIGVQIAQSFGVRVHLLGIEPSRGSQSHALLQEADTTTEWDKDMLAGLMSLPPTIEHYTQDPEDNGQSILYGNAVVTLEQAVEGFLSSLNAEEIKSAATLEEYDAVPYWFDGKLLASCRTALGRNLNPAETRQMRKLFKAGSKVKSEGL